ncbi:hypothetical protein F5B22DRAFT_587665 [Xylaria bambusicola]|uniref:uncharacterized protein n=1 Tax=Xylaria bambusicola TaxID=326684 RepID=UPI0020082C43|nr:uncharacterized protein F5B22DRAFT_587665 [Xylaria bambusicola]KAI0525769.1 hypothetical protein F5B22DRAFT_587665 [Xylaria bambusicola]
MSAFSRWFFAKSSGSGSSDDSGLPSSSGHSINRVLSGRVTKPARAEVTPNVTKRKPSVYYSPHKEKKREAGVECKPSFDLAVFTESTKGVNSEGRQALKIKLEDAEDGEIEEKKDDEESIGDPSAMVAQQAKLQEDDDPFAEDELDSEEDPFAKPNMESDQDEEDNSDSGPDVFPKPGSDNEPDPDTAWRAEQISLNTILNARNEFTLMPLTWKMHFRGIPLPDSLFYIKMKSKSIRPRIYARTERLEYRGALALRKLIDVHARIQDIRGDEAVIKNDTEEAEAVKREFIKSLSAAMAGRLRRALEQAVDWAKQDGGIDNYGDQLPPNVKIMELKGITQNDEPDSEVKIQTEMCNLAEEWRTHASTAHDLVEAPVIFGFVIMKHIITIVTLDASDPDAIIHVPCQLHMAERNQHQWNALAVLVTICWARDVLLDYISARSDLKPEVKDESSDPDA